MTRLPIDSLLEPIVEALRGASSLVLEAPPGAGKTTRVPWRLAQALGGKIVVSEPRRLAARLAAHRVATELGEAPGERIGYSVRFEDVSSPKTLVRYVTEGVLLRRLLSDPVLEGVRAVVIDEVHERHLETDLCLALLRRLQAQDRPDLKLVVMSATLEAGAIAKFLGDCPLLRSEGRQYPVQIEHAREPDQRPLEKQVVSAVKTLVREQARGDVLVFLPGASAIRRAREALAQFASEHALLVLPLHGELSMADQAKAVGPAEQRKVVLATNVAESSVTIDGVTAVVDSGLSQSASHSPWTGLPKLALSKISQASATQRAGRAGRTEPGRVLRLYTRGDLQTRPNHDTPEIARSDLSGALLTLYGFGVFAPTQLAWLLPPPAAAVSAAANLLEQLGATDGQPALTEIGQRLLDFPLHPRLSRLLVECERRNIAKLGCLAAALLAERDIRKRSHVLFHGAIPAYDARGDSDVSELIELFEEAEQGGFDQHRLNALGLDGRRVRAVQRTQKQLAKLTRTRASRSDATSRDASRSEASPGCEAETSLRLALLTAFVDRVAERRPGMNRELSFGSGGTAKISPESCVHDARLLLALDVEEKRGAEGRSGQVTVRLASAIEPEWLLDLYPERLSDTDELVFNSASERVERLCQIRWGKLVLEESRSPAAPSPEAARVLAHAAKARGVFTFDRDDQLASLLERLRLLSHYFPELGEQLGTDTEPQTSSAAHTELASWLEQACATVTSFAELQSVGLAEPLLSQKPPKVLAALREHLPETLSLKGGRRLKVHYEPDKAPWISSRLQDFFSMTEAPRLCRGKLQVLVHLLAPNQRAVQVTSDLGGFWERHYPSLRRELMRRYPKHPWPEDGRTAPPPEPRPPRPRTKRR